MHCTGSQSYTLKNGEILDFSGGPVVTNPSANAGETGSVPAPGIFYLPGNYAHVPQLLSPRGPRAHTGEQETLPQ